jgi:hypothetical protein
MKKMKARKRSRKVSGRKASRASAMPRPVAAPAAPDSELLAARAALHDAARQLAILAREEPRFFPGKPPQEPRPPVSPSRVIHVHPTGHHKIDVDNLERAIMRAGPGGMVVLKSTDKSGAPMHFNLSKVSELSMQHEVTLKSEKRAVLRFSE